MRDPFNRWEARGPHARAICASLLLLFAVVTPLFLIEILPLGRPNDFLAFHSYAQFVRHYPAARIYDYPLLQEFQGTPAWLTYPFLYQPVMLLLVWPLGHLPYALGYVLWVAVGLAGCAIVLGFAERNLAALAALLVAPSTLLVVLNGQSSLIATALLFGAFRLMPRHPLCAGILFGLMIYKPQLGVLVPVALAAAGRWRVIVSAGCTVALVVVASLAVSGPLVWASWWHHLPVIQATVMGKTTEACFWMATVTSNLVAYGLRSQVVHVVQSITALASVVVVWLCMRRDSGMLGSAVVAVATFLTTPFPFGYDLVLVTAAIIVVVNERWQSDGIFSFGEMAVLSIGFLLPWCVCSPWMFRCGSLVIAALLYLIVHRIYMQDQAVQSFPQVRKS